MLGRQVWALKCDLRGKCVGTFIYVCCAIFLYVNVEKQTFWLRLTDFKDMSPHDRELKHLFSNKKQTFVRLSSKRIFILSQLQQT